MAGPPFDPGHWKSIGERNRKEGTGPGSKDAERIPANDGIDVSATDKQGRCLHVNEIAANQALADDIRAALRRHKGARFVIAWRLFPNKKDGYWFKDSEDSEVPSCGCGCSCGE